MGSGQQRNSKSTHQPYVLHLPSVFTPICAPSVLTTALHRLMISCHSVRPFLYKTFRSTLAKISLGDTWCERIHCLGRSDCYFVPTEEKKNIYIYSNNKYGILNTYTYIYIYYYLMIYPPVSSDMAGRWEIPQRNGSIFQLAMFDALQMGL